MKIPAINIFLISQVPEVDEEEDERNLLAEALLNKRHEDMMGVMSSIADKLRRLPFTSHVGGG